MFKEFVKKEQDALTEHVKAVKGTAPSAWVEEDETNVDETAQKSLRSTLAPVRSGFKVASDFVQCAKRARNMRNLNRAYYYAQETLHAEARWENLELHYHHAKKLAAEEV